MGRWHEAHIGRKALLVGHIIACLVNQCIQCQEPVVLVLPVALVVAGVPGLALVLSVVLRCTWSGTGGQHIIDQPADMLLGLSWSGSPTHFSQSGNLTRPSPSLKLTFENTQWGKVKQMHPM